MNKKKLYILIFLLLLILAVALFVNIKYLKNDNHTAVTPTPKVSAESPTSSPTLAATPTPEPTITPIPEAYLIENVPFQPQAPYANWDELHDEACEEAALILVNYYLLGKNLTAEIMEDEIQKMVSWQIDYFGSHKDLTIEETAEMANKYYRLENFKVKNNITIEDVKVEIASNNLVIVPTAGRMLGNPYFRSPGPIYHMLVIIGYDGNEIIVQDIGTRRGNHYRYSQKVLYNAIHDWNGAPENIEGGQKSILVFE